MTEPGLTAVDLERIGGRMMLAAGNLAGRVYLSVSAWEPGAPNTKAALMESVKQALDDYELTAVLE
jgi:hypothetical protein